MTRGILTAFALAGLLAVGCEEERKAPTDAKQDAADKAGSAAKDKADQVESAAKGAVNVAQDRAKAAENNAEKAGNAAENNAEAAGKAGVDAVKSAADQVVAIKDNFDKAINAKKFDEADTYIKQLEALNRPPLDQAKRDEIAAALVTMRQKVADGRRAMTP
jgi:flagellum-specific peptidoglycan hydrolase FlgJ